MNISKKQLLYGTGLLLTGLLTGWLLFSGSPADNDHSAHNLQNQHEIEQHVQDSHTDENGEISLKFRKKRGTFFVKLHTIK